MSVDGEEASWNVEEATARPREILTGGMTVSADMGLRGRVCVDPIAISGRVGLSVEQARLVPVVGNLVDDPAKLSLRLSTT